jgi:TPR repeat protein
MINRVTFNHVTAMVLGCITTLTIASDAASTQEVGKNSGTYPANNDKQTITILKTNAENGDSTAQYLLGTLYTVGEVVPQDEYRAFFWYKRSAEEGLVEGQFQLGMMYLEGEGITESEDDGVKWIRRAAKRGHSRAREVLELIMTRDFTIGC